MKLTKPNCALAQKSVGKKIFNYGQVSTNITTKNRPKHGLYTMLCFRFNEAQRMGVYCRFNAIYTVLYAGTVNLAET